MPAPVAFPPDCEAVVRALWDYLDGAVGEEDKHSIEEHLAACQRCCGEAGDLRGRSRRLRQERTARRRAIARGRDGKFLPAGICWVVERSFAWISNYRRLNTIFERTKEHLVAFIEIAFVSILARRLKRLAIDEVSA